MEGQAHRLSATRGKERTHVNIQSSDRAGHVTEALEIMVRLQSVSKTYGSRNNRVAALTNVTIDFPSGTFTAVMGASGSGKSTLLQCAAGLDRVDTGEVVIAGAALGGMKENALTRLRRAQIGFVFQSFNLVPSLTAQQNVALPLRLAGHRPTRAEIISVRRPARPAFRGTAATGRHRSRCDDTAAGAVRRRADWVAGLTRLA
jgi:ABC-type sulfate/molybdate transport systems ATPase subunit